MDEHQLIALSDSLSSSLASCRPGDDSIVLNGINMHFPEMIFGQDRLTISSTVHDACVDINARDSLFQWAKSHESGEVQVIKVPQAWARREHESVHANEYDWTFTTDYCFTYTSEGSSDSISATNAREHARVQETSSSGINLDLLKARAPILFYDEVSI